MLVQARLAAAGALALLPVTWPMLLGPFTSEGSDQIAAEVALTFADERIDESSGLVVTGDTVLTVNDSGDGPSLYGVDRATGETTGVTTFSPEDPVDVEALAPGTNGAVWVGDIGDNRRSRESVTVSRVDPAPGGGTVDAPAYTLRYADGPHDAETLLVHPRTERVLLVTKRPFIGGEVHRAPADLRPGVVHRLEKVATVPGMVTDGAFLPNGDHVLLRTYGSAAVYTYPGFDQVVSFELPEQEQGEALAIGPDGRVYLSTEGELSDVLVVDLPEVVREGTSAAGGGPTAEPEPPPREAPDQQAGSGATEPDSGGGASYLAVPAAVLGAAGLAWAVRASRRRSRRTL